MCSRMSCLAILLGAIVVTTPARGENWPQWRGARLDGMSQEKNIPTEWTNTVNVAWKLPMPGSGGATPAIWGNSIFVTSVHGEKLVLLCIDTDGKLKWEQNISEGDKILRVDEGNSASPSPCTDGEHVWAMFTNGDMACFKFDGTQVWKLSLQEQFGKFNIQFGMTSTPVLDGDSLYVQLIHGDGKPETREATVARLGKKSGKVVWQTGRPSEAHTENEHSYASPVLYRDRQREFLLTHGADYIVAHDLKDGHELWRCGGLHPATRYDPTLRFVSSPLAVPGLIIVPSAKKGVTLALKPDGTGNITENSAQRYWKFDITPDVPSPLVVDDIVYLCRENGNLIALNRATGSQYYEGTTVRGRHRASPVFADGKIFLTSRDGQITVCKPGTEFKILATNKMGEEISASPAISDGTLYLRTFTNLYAIRSK